MSNAGATTTSSETDPYLSEASNVTNGSANARNQAALTVGVSDRPPFGVKDDIRRERKPPDRNILDRDRIVDGLRQWGIVIVFVAIIVTFSWLRPTTFMTFQNVVNVVNNSSSLLLFAMAATLALGVSVACDGVLTGLRLIGTGLSVDYLIPIISMAFELGCAGALVLMLRSARQRMPSAAISLKS